MVFSAQRNQTLSHPAAGPELTPKDAFWGWLSVHRALCHILMMTVLVLGACCKAVGGRRVRKRDYNEHGHPTAQPPDWDFCTPPLHGIDGVKWHILLQCV